MDYYLNKWLKKKIYIHGVLVREINDSTLEASHLRV